MVTEADKGALLSPGGTDEITGAEIEGGAGQVADDFADLADLEPYLDPPAGAPDSMD